MKPTTLTAEQVRDLDRRAKTEFHLPTLILMENAGRGVADLVERSLIPPIASCQVVVVCGSGNNGGDGFVTARHLLHRRIPVDIFLTTDADDLSGDALTNYRIIRAIGAPVMGLDQWTEQRLSWARRPLVVVDAILGTGFRPPLRAAAARGIGLINELRETHTSSLKVISIDVPSGLDADDGVTGPDTVRADMTATLACYKPGLTKSESRTTVGRIELVDIGVPDQLLEAVASPRKSR